MTNDAWYGKTVAPWQHAWLAQWRAIETRRTLVRVTNTGLTTVINAKGEMIETLPTFVPGLVTTEAAILDGKSPYVRFGDWFAWGASLASITIISKKIKGTRKSIPMNRRTQ
jgi:apolipoprotein N-acyltransferase